MAENTNIEWATHTFNPWRGCAKVSPACASCYAEKWAKRNPEVFGEWGPKAKRVIASEAYWQKPLQWNRQAAASGSRPRVFCASLADVFEDRSDLVAPRERLWELIHQTPHLDWLLLTKRPHHMAAWANHRGWPRNAWAGTTVENQKCADERIEHLLQVPASVRFLSMEPLLGPVNLTRVHRTFDPAFGPPPPADIPVRFDALLGKWHPIGSFCPGYVRERIQWVIAGGESGPRARPSHPDWFRSIRNQCRDAGVPFLFKQWGAHRPVLRGEPLPKRAIAVDSRGRQKGLDERFDPVQGDVVMGRLGKKAAGRVLDGETWDGFPFS